MIDTKTRTQDGRARDRSSCSDCAMIAAAPADRRDILRSPAPASGLRSDDFTLTNPVSAAIAAVLTT